MYISYICCISNDGLVLGEGCKGKYRLILFPEGCIVSYLIVNFLFQLARNIFEMGLKKYIHEPAYVLE